MKEAERLLKSLANRRRLAIVRYLKGRREASVGDIAAAIKLSLKATSKHLGLLYTVDILERAQRTLLMSYRLSKAPPRLIGSVIANL